MSKEEKHHLDVAETAALAGEGAETLMFMSNTATKYVPGAQVAVSALSSTAEYNSGIRKYEDKMGRSLEGLSNGYAVSGEYDPGSESEHKVKTNAGISFGKGVFLAVTGLLAIMALPVFFVAGPPGWALAVVSIAACFAGSWVYDKFVGQSDAQDPLLVAGAMREKRDAGEQVPKELTFGLMIVSMNPDDPFRKEVEARMKNATGTKKMDEILDDPAKWPALGVVMQDPAVVKKMCEHYGVMPDGQFFERVTGLYNQGLVDTRSILYAHSGDISLACLQDQTLQQREMAQAKVPQANLPAAPIKGRDAGLSGAAV